MTGHFHSETEKLDTEVSWFQVQPEMPRHPTEKTTQNLAWPSEVELEVSRHSCLLVGVSASMAIPLEWKVCTFRRRRGCSSSVFYEETEFSQSSSCFRRLGNLQKIQAAFSEDISELDNTQDASQVPRHVTVPPQCDACLWLGTALRKQRSGCSGRLVFQSKSAVFVSRQTGGFFG